MLKKTACARTEVFADGLNYHFISRFHQVYDKPLQLQSHELYDKPLQLQSHVTQLQSKQLKTAQ